MATHRTINQVFIVLLVCVFAGLDAPAAAGTSLSKHGDWEAFTDRESGKLVCYMGSVPTKSRGKYTKRSRTFLLITHRPAERSKNVISLQAGYTFKKKSEVELAIGKTSFKLFTDEQWADYSETSGSRWNTEPGRARSVPKPWPGSAVTDIELTFKNHGRDVGVEQGHAP